MIDNIKFYISGKDSFESFILKDGIVDLKASKSFLTDKIEEYPKKGKLENLDVVINDKRAYVKGSFHKLGNILMDNGSQNFDDFNLCQMKSTVKEVLSYLKAEGRTSITQLELGLNLKFPMNPKTFIRHNLLMWNYEDHNKDLQFRSKGDFKEFHRTDYHLKIYNKSKQYAINSYILRVELKILTKRKLQELGVYSLENLLDDKVIESIFALLLKEVKKCTIIDDFEHHEMPQSDMERLYRFTNPNYWKTLKETKTLKVQSGFKKQFRILMEKYGLLKNKNSLMRQMIEKFWELIKCPESKSQFLNAA